MKTIYLSGPIMYVTPEESIEWRKIAEEKLGKDFIVLNPLRRNFRDCEFLSTNEIVCFDKADVKSSDILLVNTERPSWGTAMELFYGHSLGKFVVSFCSEKNLGSWVIYHSTKCLGSLEEAISYIKKNFGGDLI